MSRIVKASSLLVVLLLGGCGFHLRQSVALPPSMQRIHLTVSGGGNLQRNLARALRGSGVVVEDASGPGIAELAIPQAAFSNDMLSVSGYSRVTEYAVHYMVRFSVSDGRGSVLIPAQDIRMSREYSYDAGNTIGNDAQVEEIQRSLNDDMVQSILFRLQAAARHAEPAAPASAASAG